MTPPRGRRARSDDSVSEAEVKAPRPRTQRRGGQGGTEPPLRRRRREQLVIDRSTAGDSQYDIARDLKISQSAVSQILRRVDDRWAQENLAVIGRHKAAEARKLDHVHREALRAWEESKAQKTRRRQRKTEGASSRSGGTVAEVTVEDSHGDPRFLETARRALADRARLWGPPTAVPTDTGTAEEPAIFTLTIGDDRTAPHQPVDPLVDEGDEHGGTTA